MHPRNHRARLAIGAAVLAAAGFAAAGSLSAAPESAPPTSPPGSTEPADVANASAPPLGDPARDELVASIVDAAAEDGFPLDPECVAGLVAQVPDEDLAVVVEEIASAGAAAATATAGVVTMPEYSVESAPGSAVADDSTADSAGETTPVETMTIESAPMVSPITEELGQQLITCAAGDADPALVAEALTVIQSDPEAPSFDMACVEAVLSTFSDETLTLIIEDPGMTSTATAADVETAVETVAPSETEVVTETAPDPAATAPGGTDVVEGDPLGSIPEEAITEAFTLLICSPEFLEGVETIGSEVVTAESSPAVESVAEDTVVEPTESTMG